MYLPLASWTPSELEDAIDKLSDARDVLKRAGCYRAYAAVLEITAEARSQLARRQAELRAATDRQLSMVPPGAYDEPR